MIEAKKFEICGSDLVRCQRKALRQARSLREICGVLVAKGRFLFLVETRNAETRLGSFKINRREFLALVRNARGLGCKVVGTFHSHVASDPIPSSGDLQGANAGELMLILDPTGRRVAIWRIETKLRASRVPFIATADAPGGNQEWLQPFSSARQVRARVKPKTVTAQPRSR